MLWLLPNCRAATEGERGKEGWGERGRLSFSLCVRVCERDTLLLAARSWVWARICQQWHMLLDNSNFGLPRQTNWCCFWGGRLGASCTTTIESPYGGGGHTVHDAMFGSAKRGWGSGSRASCQGSGMVCVCMCVCCTVHPSHVEGRWGCRLWSQHICISLMLLPFLLC